MLIELVLVLSTVSLVACDRDLCSVSASTESAAIKIVTPQELGTLVASDRKPTIIDANPKEIFDDGHVPGARWLATDNVREVLPDDRNAFVVFYCYSEACGASHAAAKQARDAGWTNVARMSVGITGWKAAGLPVEK